MSEEQVIVERHGATMVITYNRPHARHALNRAVSEAVEAALDSLELADSIARCAPLAVVASKKILDEVSGWSAEEVWARKGEIAGPALFSADAREGATAFAEKREPVWKGR
jgi:enoyl-CoA hydratase